MLGITFPKDSSLYCYVLLTPEVGEGCFLIFPFGYQLYERGRRESFLSAHVILCSFVKQSAFSTFDAELHEVAKGLAKLLWEEGCNGRSRYFANCIRVAFELCFVCVCLIL